MCPPLIYCSLIIFISSQEVSRDEDGSRDEERSRDHLTSLSRTFLEGDAMCSESEGCPHCSSNLQQVNSHINMTSHYK